MNQSLGDAAYTILLHPGQAVTVVVGVLDGHPHGTVVVSTFLKSGHACKFLKHSSGLTVDVTVGQEFAAAVALDAMKLVERV